MIKSMRFEVRSQILILYFLFAYLAVFALSLRYLKGIVLYDLRTGLFVIAVLLSYSFFYLLPALLLTKLMDRLLRFRQKERGLAHCGDAAVYITALLSTAFTLIFLFTDGFIYNLYGFHLNGFVWNLIVTPGGIESMGGGRSTTATCITLVLGLLVLQALLLVALNKFLQKKQVLSLRPRRKLYLSLLLILLLVSAGERLTYGISELQSHTPTLLAGGGFPFYKGMTLHRLARKLGYEVKNKERLHLAVDSSGLDYPKKPLQVDKPARPYNVVWLMAESLRADMLDPEIMPAAWSFAQQAHRFTHHYSGGNGTRMAVFSAFYGLYGAYWFPFLGLQRSPVLMDVLQEQNYQFGLYTSQSFTYPELDKTVFAKIPREFFHEDNNGFGWERDRRNIGDLISFIRDRDPNRPFMTFMFFESPHARYYFPEESVIRRPYLEDFNYATMSLERDIDLIKNRYINACHHLDSQIGRVLETLKQENLLENTIVLLAGDHGEEFLEKGRWGHNSRFSEEQVRTPLVLWVPGSGASQVDRMTSHLDIPATLLPLLGVKNPSEDYSLGYDLLGQQVRRFTVVSDWDRIGYIDDSFKASFPLKTTGILQNQVTDKEDKALADGQSFFSSHQRTMLELMQNLKKFSQQ